MNTQRPHINFSSCLLPTVEAGITAETAPRTDHLSRFNPATQQIWSSLPLGSCKPGRLGQCLFKEVQVRVNRNYLPLRYTLW